MLKLPSDETSLWREAYPAVALYAPLTENLEVDVAIVGAGITGLTTAYLLKKAGYKVAVVEKHTVGGGTTGRTTGKVTSQHNLVYADLQKRLGAEGARLYGEANQAAIDLIEQIILKEKIDCDWQRDDNYVFTADSSQVEKFRQEAKAAANLGLPASFESQTPLPFEIQGAVKFTGQAQFHSEKYVLGLARAVHGDGSYVFENSNVIGIRDGNPGRIRTTKGKITAKHIVVASSVPTMPLIARGGYSLHEYPSESYIVAGRLSRNQEGMYISPDKHHYSILPVTIGRDKYLLIGGESHFWGLRGNRQKRYQKLADYAEKHFGITEISNRWSDRDYLAYDSVPLVGKLYPWSQNLYVATGMKKWGLTNGTAAAMILSDTISGANNPWSETFDSQRLRTVKALPGLIYKTISGS